MSKFKYLNNEQYFLILRYLETTTNKFDQISFEKMEKKKNCTKLVTLVTYHNLDLGRVEKSFLSLDFRMGTSSTST